METAKCVFNIVKQLSKSDKFKVEILKRKKIVIQYILDCLRDQDVQIDNKKDALALIPFVAIDTECL